MTGCVTRRLIPSQGRPAGALVAVGLLLGCIGCERAITPGPHADLEQALTIRETLASESTGGGTTAVAATGTGWANLTGFFRLEEGATPRPRQPKNVNKDVGVCAPGGKRILDQVMLVDDETRGIANVVIFLRDTSRVHDSAKPKTEPALFDQEECIFLSHVFTMNVNQPVEIKNSDPIGHNTNIVANRGLGFNQTIPANQSLVYTPTAEESLPVPVNCSIHPWMQAYMLPRENNYVAVTKPDGTFELPMLPAGEELEFQVWHENATGPGGALEAKPEWRRGRLELKLQENEDARLEVIVPGTAFKG